MTLEVPKFMRRFLLHVLPSGFHRIRHYGMLANAGRKPNLARVHALLLCEALEADGVWLEQQEIWHVMALACNQYVWLPTIRQVTVQQLAATAPPCG